MRLPLPTSKIALLTAGLLAVAWGGLTGAQAQYELGKLSFEEVKSRQSRKDDQMEYLLGMYYMFGIGTEADPKKAVTEFKGSYKTVPEAANMLGWCYEAEVGVGSSSRNARTAFGYYEQAAEAGLDDAKYKVAVFLIEGRGGLDKDYGRAGSLLRELATKNHPEACYLYGWLITITAEGPKIRDAQDFFIRAAEQRNVKAMIALADMHKAGKGVERNLLQAYKWYRIASVYGDSFGSQQLKELPRLYSGRFRPGDQALAESEAEEFLRKFPPGPPSS